jgi:hypothetical protein
MRAGIASTLANRKPLREGKIIEKRCRGRAILPNRPHAWRESETHGRPGAGPPDSGGQLIY